jgi:acyl dehydratase
LKLANLPNEEEMMTEQYKVPLFIEDVYIGDQAPNLVWDNLERKDFVKYAGASGDFNPLHYSEPHAKQAGYSQVFAQGMFSAGFLSHMVTDWVGLRNLAAYRTRFTAQVWPGDTITANGEITSVNKMNGEILADIWVTNQEGTKVVEGDITANLPSRE